MSRRALMSLLCAAAASLFGLPAAHAAWLGLDDGDYAVALNCTFSSQIACPSVTHGTMTLQGGQVSSWDFLIDGQHYTGDPGDAVVSTPLLDAENASESNPGPFNFLSLRLITAGGINPFVTGDRWWVYCSNAGNPGSCSPNTTGLWEARRVAAVPEPSPAALLALAVVAAVGAGRHVRRR